MDGVLVLIPDCRSVNDLWRLLRGANTLRAGVYPKRMKWLARLGFEFNQFPNVLGKFFEKVFLGVSFPVGLRVEVPVVVLACRFCR